MKDNELPFFLLKTFARALGHQLRTPLSVISNDLSFLKASESTLECDRSINRCKELGSILKESTELFYSELSWKKIALISLWQELSESLKFDLVFEQQDFDKLIITGDESILIRSLTELVKLFASLTTDKSVKVKLSHEQEAKIVLEGKAAISTEQEVEQSSFSAFYQTLSKEDTIWLPLVDAVLSLHKMTLCGKIAAETLILVIKVPLN